MLITRFLQTAAVPATHPASPALATVLGATQPGRAELVGTAGRRPEGAEPATELAPVDNSLPMATPPSAPATGASNAVPAVVPVDVPVAVAGGAVPAAGVPQRHSELGPGRLLLDFLHFYGAVFDPRRTVVRILTTSQVTNQDTTPPSNFPLRLSARVFVTPLNTSSGGAGGRRLAPRVYERAGPAVH